MLEKCGKDVDIGDTTWRLHGEDVVAPPRSSRPPQSTSPNIVIFAHVVQAARQSGQTGRVVSTCELANDALLLVRTKPLRCGDEAVLENGAVDTGGAGARAVAVRGELDEIFVVKYAEMV